MTAARKPTGAPIWHSRGHCLSPDARAALISALGFPADSQDAKLIECLRTVEYCLGFYSGGREAIDNAPSAAVYVRELETVKTTALKLMTLLNSPADGINPFTRDALSEHFEKTGSMSGPDGIGKATTAAGCVVFACNSALKELQPEARKESRGRKKAGSREIVITELLELYGKYSKRRNKVRDKKGAVEQLSEFEKCRLCFVRAAFKEINADNFNDTRGDQKWLELIRQARAPSVVEPRHRKKG